MPDYPSPGNFEMLTVTNAVKTLTSTAYTPTSGKYVGCQPFYAFLSVDGADIRFTLDGTTPVAGTTGHLLTSGDSLTLHGKEAMMNFKAIRNASTDVLLAVTYFFVV